MKKLFALVAVALTLCGLLTACGSKTETASSALALAAATASSGI